MKPQQKVPVNQSSLDASKDAVSQDVDYAFRVFENYRDRLAALGERLIGARVLELGPGPSLGTAILLASAGAEITVADRFPAIWNPRYHPRFFCALLRQMRRSGTTDFDPDPVIRLLLADEFSEDVIRIFGKGTEDLGELGEGIFDIVVSNAVLEHVRDAEATARALAQVTAEGGLHLHQVDFRDHRTLHDKPLEFLTMAPEDFAELFRVSAGECGNRVGHVAWRGFAEAAGLQVSEFEPNMFATDEYLADVRPRLHPDFVGRSEEELRVISGLLVLRRDSRTFTEHPTESDSPQTLAHCRARYALVLEHVEGKRVLDVGCGAGVGTRALLAGKPTAVDGVDVDEAALEAARAAGPEAVTYHHADLEKGLGAFAEGVFDVVVCLEVLEHVEAQQQLIGELHRVAADGALVVVSVPHLPFETFWTQLTDEPNPFHVHVPTISEFESQLKEFFSEIQLLAQADFVSSFVLPLGDQSERAALQVEAPTTVSLSDRGTITVLAMCRKGEGSVELKQPASGVAYGDHQEALGTAKLHAARVTARMAELQIEQFASQNSAKWSNLGVRERLLAPRNMLKRISRGGVLGRALVTYQEWLRSRAQGGTGS